MDEDDLPEAKTYVYYRWDCECGEVNDTGDIEQSGEVLACDGCGQPTRILGQ